MITTFSVVFTALIFAVLLGLGLGEGINLMTDLVTHLKTGPSQFERGMNLYCWPHRTVHEFTLKDVEKIVYALGVEAITAYQSGFDDGSADVEPIPTRLPEDPPQCLLEVLRGADDIEVYAEHVEQGIECREKA